MSRQRSGIVSLVAAVLLASNFSAPAQVKTPESPAVPLPTTPARPPGSEVSYPFEPGLYAIGKKDATLVLVEYADYQCPFCQRFHNDVFARIKSHYIDTGTILFVSRDFPLGFHENAMGAAMAARCAAEQGRFWDFRDTLIVNADQLQPDKIAGYAEKSGLDVNQLKRCVESNKYKAGIDEDIAEGRLAGVTGTPAFVLGRVQGGKIKGLLFIGAMSYEQFDVTIQDVLKEGPASRN